MARICFSGLRRDCAEEVALPVIEYAEMKYEVPASGSGDTDPGEIENLSYAIAKARTVSLRTVSFSMSSYLTS